MSASEKPSAAVRAVAHIMRMMRESRDYAYLLGFGTRSYEMLKEAYEEASVEPREPFESLIKCADDQPREALRRQAALARHLREVAEEQDSHAGREAFLDAARLVEEYRS